MTVAHREKIGGGRNWDRLGAFQFQVLIDEGLRESHRLLDIGCGPLRAGKLFIAYLQAGCYHGTDASGEAIEAGLYNEVPEHIDAAVIQDEDFRFDKFRTKFDFLLAHSLFGWLPLEEIERCLVSAANVMTPASKFLFTFKAMRDATEHRLWEPSILMEVANRAGLQMELLPYKRQWASHQWARAVLR